MNEVKNSSNAKKMMTLDEMYARQNELQYSAMAMQQIGQLLPDEDIVEYEKLKTDIKAELLKQLNNMQYGAMANALSGIPTHDEFRKEYADLQWKVDQL